MVFDGTPPFLTSEIELSSLTGRYSAQQGFNALAVSLNVSESVLPSQVQVWFLTEAGEDTFNCGNAETSEFNVYCNATIDGTEGEGLKTVEVKITDAAGNSTLDAVNITLDFTPPNLVDTQVAPALAKLGDTLYYDIIPDEPLGEFNPSYVTTIGPSELVWSQVGNLRKLSHVVQAGEDGSYDVQVELVDNVGNRSQPLDGVSFSIDAVAPQITNVTTNADHFSLQPGHDILELVFEVSETLAVLAVSLGGIQVDCGTVFDATAPINCTHTFTLEELGNNHFSVPNLRIEGADAAGNTVSTAMPITLDTRPPVLSAYELTPLRAKLGDTVSLNLFFDEPLAEAPHLDAHEAAEPTFTNGLGDLGFSHVTGSTYSYLLSINETTPEGQYVFQVTFADAVGNETVLNDFFTDDAVFEIERTVPVISDTPSTAYTYSLQPGHNLMELHLEASEPLDSLVALLPLPSGMGSVAMDCQWPEVAGPGVYCQYELPSDHVSGDVQASQPVSVVGYDAMGNRGDLNLVFTIDNETPKMVFGQVTPETAKLGDTVVLALAFSEPLSEAPTLLNTELPLALVADSQYAYNFVATEAFSGSHTLDVKATDLLGNENTFEGIVVNVDSEVPELSAPPTPDGGVVDRLPFQIRNGQTGAPQMLFSAQDGHNHVQVQFDVSESLDASDDSNANLAVTLAGHTMDCGSYQAQSPNYTCTYVVTGEESEGGNLIEINGNDGAGNTVYANQAVQFDFTLPQWVSGTVSLSLQGPLNEEVDLSNYDVSALALGGQVSFSGAVSESLSERQVVLDINGDSFIDADDIFLDASVTSGNFVGFNLTLTESVSDGVYPLLFRFVDTVGNATVDGFNMIEMADGTMTQVTIDQRHHRPPIKAAFYLLRAAGATRCSKASLAPRAYPVFTCGAKWGQWSPTVGCLYRKPKIFPI